MFIEKFYFSNQGLGLSGMFLSIPLSINPFSSYIGNEQISAINFSPFILITSTFVPISISSKSKRTMPTPHSKYGDQVDELITPIFLLLIEILFPLKAIPSFTLIPQILDFFSAFSNAFLPTKSDLFKSTNFPNPTSNGVVFFVKSFLL